MHDTLDAFETPGTWPPRPDRPGLDDVRAHNEQANVSEAVARGTGLAGCHGGMCDAFRDNALWQFMTGGHGSPIPAATARYTVRMTEHGHRSDRGIEDFEVATEQYYMHVDPANRFWRPPTSRPSLVSLAERPG